MFVRFSCFLGGVRRPCRSVFDVFFLVPWISLILSISLFTLSGPAPHFLTKFPCGFALAVVLVVVVYYWILRYVNRLLLHAHVFLVFFYYVGSIFGLASKKSDFVSKIFDFALKIFAFS